MSTISSTHTSTYSRNAFVSYKEGYEGIDYIDINAFLRNNIVYNDNNDSDAKQTRKQKRLNTIIRSLDSKLVPNTNPKLYVYRGMSKEAYEIYKEQGVIVNKGYLSTSKDIEIAKEFSRQTGVILKFLIPVDFKIHKFLDNSDDDEYEILIERDTQLVSLIEKNKNGNTYIYCKLRKYINPV